MATAKRMTPNTRPKKVAKYKPGEIFYLIYGDDFFIEIIEAVEDTYPPYRIRSFEVRSAGSGSEVKVRMLKERASHKRMEEVAGSCRGKKGFALAAALHFGGSIDRIERTCYRKLRQKLSRELEEHEELRQGTRGATKASHDKKCQHLTTRIEDLEEKIKAKGGRVRKRKTK